jgi:hypothetical protein
MLILPNRQFRTRSALLSDPGEQENPLDHKEARAAGYALSKAAKIIVASVSATAARQQRWYNMGGVFKMSSVKHYPRGSPLATAPSKDWTLSGIRMKFR